jgi:SAM-dependent methyltransferase
MTAEPNSRADWQARYAARLARDKGPSRWVLERMRILPPRSTICDIAGGIGRHAIPIAEMGHHVVLIDFIETAVRFAMQQSPGTAGVVADASALPLKEAVFDAVLVTNFLDRDLIPALIALLKPGGHFVYETYTTEHAALVAAGLARAPRSARYLLRRGELPELVAGLTILASREGEVHDEAGRRACASVHGVRGPLSLATSN